jgi:hypothetical protein
MKEVIMKLSHFLTVSLAVIVVVGLCIAAAEVPKTINYQGRLTDDTGEPLNDTVDVRFLFYDDSVGGPWLHIDTHLDVPIHEGAFNVVMGENNAIPDWLFDDDERWFQLVVGEDSIKPRTRFTSVPYAYHAKYADTSGYSLTGTPIAYGAIDYSGAIQSGTPNFTSTWNATESRYEITINGGGYIYDTHATIVTPIGNGTSLRVPLTGSSGGNLIVYILDSGDNKVQSRFHFVVFKP